MDKVPTKDGPGELHEEHPHRFQARCGGHHTHHCPPGAAGLLCNHALRSVAFTAQQSGAYGALAGDRPSHRPRFP